MGESSSTENKSQSLPEGIAVKSIYKALKNNMKIWMTKALRYAIFKPFYARIVVGFFYNLKHLQSEFSSLLHHGTTVHAPASRCNMLAAVENGLTWLTIKS